MRTNYKKRSRSRHGVLAFEWALIVTILVVGIISGVATMRDILAIEIADTINATSKIDAEFVKPTTP